MTAERITAVLVQGMENVKNHVEKHDDSLAAFATLYQLSRLVVSAS
jgi:hypothetical protein